MRKTLLMSATLLSLAAPAFAQSGSSVTQTPPSPNANTTEPQATNSLPPGAATASGRRAGDSVGGHTTAPPDRGLSGVRPMRGQRHDAASADSTMPAEHPRRMRRSEQARMDAGSGGTYDGGRNVPMSSRASNIDAGDSHSEIAPRLPSPDSAANTPEAFLAAAQRALAAGRTGQAQEALERAETRVLTRSTEPAAANTADSSPMVQQIAEARRALGRRDTAGARQAISAAMSSGSGGPGRTDGMPMRSGTGGPAMGGPAGAGR